MSEQSATQRPEPATPAASVEDVLRTDLAYGDTMLGTVGPILGHLVLNHDQSLFTDAIIARVRGMLADVARQLIDIEIAHVGRSSAQEEETKASSDQPSSGDDSLGAARHAALAQALATNPEFLGHCHALAIEFQLAERLKSRNSLDPVLTPLLQSFIAAKDEEVASNAMAALTAQARFMEHQRRMSLPLAELHAPVLHHAAACWQNTCTLDKEADVAAISAAIRNSAPSAKLRENLFLRLLDSMGSNLASALSLTHAGVSLFLSALSATSGLSRAQATLATNDRQMARLALSLRGAGLKIQTIEEQFLYLHPDIELPEDFDTIRPDAARAMLASSGGTGG